MSAPRVALCRDARYSTKSGNIIRKRPRRFKRGFHIGAFRGASANRAKTANRSAKWHGFGLFACFTVRHDSRIRPGGKPSTARQMDTGELARAPKKNCFK